MTGEIAVQGTNSAAPFSLKVHRGDGMCLLGMDWTDGLPSADMVGFTIEYLPPGNTKFLALRNRLTFATPPKNVGTNPFSTLFAPIQKFRWVHFPFDPERPGEYRYRVRPAFMDGQRNIGWGEAQEVGLELRRETYPGLLNVAFARGFVSSQAFVDRYQSAGPISELLPKKADDGLTFQPAHPKTKQALAWMGFEARSVILELLDQAIADPTAEVRAVAYDLNEPEIVRRLEALGPRLRIVIDDSAGHGEADSAESQAAARLAASTGPANVKRQHMDNLQHNKTVVVQGDQVQAVLCGSTNFTWRGFFVQANNAMVLQGKNAVKRFLGAFNDYWHNDKPGDFGQTASAKLTKIRLKGIDARVGFSPYAQKNSLLGTIADDIGNKTTSSLFYSLAFLFQTEGAIKEAIKKVTKDKEIFVYGISDRKVGGIDLQRPDGNVAPVYPAALTKNVPEPFKSEPTGGGGNRMHHKFVVIDFDKPSARVYLGSNNFSSAADTKNGENLLLIRDRRIAVSYVVEALRIFDHYHFRVAQQEAKKAKRKLQLGKPPRSPGEKPWWAQYYTNARKIRDRELFA